MDATAIRQFVGLLNAMKEGEALRWRTATGDYYTVSKEAGEVVVNIDGTMLTRQRIEGLDVEWHYWRVGDVRSFIGLYTDEYGYLFSLVLPTDEGSWEVVQ